MLYTVINIVRIDSNLQHVGKLCEENAEPLHQVVHYLIRALHDWWRNVVFYGLFCFDCHLPLCCCVSVIPFREESKMSAVASTQFQL